MTPGGDAPLSSGNDVEMKAARDIVVFQESTKIKKTGLTVTLRENVSRSVNTLAATPKAAQGGEGGTANKAATAVSAVMDGLSAINTLTGNLVEAEASLGTSSSSTTQSQNASVARAGTIHGGNDVTITSGRDATLEGTQVAAERDVTIEAGRDLNIVAAQSTFDAQSGSKSRSASLSGTVGIGISGPTASASLTLAGANSKRGQTALTHDNAQITAGRDVTLKSGQDTTLQGAEVRAGTDLTLDTGRNLTVASVQNRSTLRGTSTSFNLSVSTSTNPSNDNAPRSDGGSIGGSTGSETGNRRFTDGQTVLIANGDVTISTGQHTQLDGAVIASNGGDVTLDTNTFGFRDLTDSDTYKNTTLGGSLSLSRGKDKNGNTTGTSPDATLAYAKETRTLEGVSRATIAAPSGKTTITIRANPEQGIEGLNKTLARAQEISRNEHTKVRVVIDTAAAKTLVDGARKLFAAVDEVLADVTTPPPPGEAPKSTDQQINEIEQKLTYLGKGDLSVDSPLITIAADSAKALRGFDDFLKAGVEGLDLTDVERQQVMAEVIKAFKVQIERNAYSFGANGYIEFGINPEGGIQQVKYKRLILKIPVIGPMLAKSIQRAIRRIDPYAQNANNAIRSGAQKAAKALRSGAQKFVQFSERQAVKY